jgi:hypothetical protein
MGTYVEISYGGQIEQSTVLKGQGEHPKFNQTLSIFGVDTRDTISFAVKEYFNDRDEIIGSRELRVKDLLKQNGSPLTKWIELFSK